MWRRRNFLIRGAQALGGFFLPRAEAFQLHPRYRATTPFDDAVGAVEAGAGDFLTEQYHEAIAPLLAGWSRGLLESAQDTRPMRDTFSARFLGAGARPIDSRPLRPASPTLAVQALRFSAEATLPADPFLNEWRAALGDFSKILTADFQITAIEAQAAGLATRVRYELVGAGAGFYREHRVGYWSLRWERSGPGGYALTRWLFDEEVRSRTLERSFADVTHSAFGANASYAAQMLHGSDYWRTVLDGASGIDIYGHNGVSAGDFDGSGHDGVYVCQPAGLPNRLYRNRGDGTFEDITESSGTGVLENTACALFADFSNNGRQDLLVVRANGPLLFLNQGNGKFALKPGAFRFANPPQGTFTGAAAADYNRDGLLDVYFCLYVYYAGADQYKYPTPYFAAENGPPNFLMRNEGNGMFRDVTAESGLNQNNTRYSFCCGWADFNGDGLPDLYVVNDFGRKNLYRNNGDGTFSDVAAAAGVEDVGAGMSVCWLDYDNDAAQDLYVANMWTAAGERLTADSEFQKTAAPEIRAFYRKHAMGNSLFRNSAGSFQNATAASHTGMGRWSWSSDTFDFDHDGFADLYIANGMISGAIRRDLNSFFWRRVVAQSPASAQPAAAYEQGWKAINELIRADYTWSGYERNVFYANNGDGTFSDVSGALGLDFREDGRAFALADFDGDGRQELLLKNRNAPQLRLLKNTISALPPAIAFRLRGTKSNRDAIGATIVLESGLGKQAKTLEAGSGFLSQHSKELFFGLGAAQGNARATIRWPSGFLQRLKDLPPNHRVWVTEGSDATRMEPFATYRAPGDSPEAPAESFPATLESWLLAPLPAPGAGRGKPRVVTFSPDTSPDDETAAIYNLLFRGLFDRHRDLPLPASFLLDEEGRIVKVYLGPVEEAKIAEDMREMPRTDAARLAKALPFRGSDASFEFSRNYLSLGSIFFQRGYYEASGEFFQAALKDDPQSAEACYGLGSVYLKQSKNDRAREFFTRAVKLKASYPETAPNAWNNLGLLAARNGETGEAISCFEEALRLDPGHFVALENLGSAYRQQKRWPEARAALERALAIQPADPEAHYNLAMVFAQQDDAEQAYQHLKKALAARPVYPEALNNLGILYLRTRRRDEAVAKFEECIRLAPDFDQAYLNLARVYTIEGSMEKARQVLRALLARRPDHAAARQALEQLH